VPRYHFDWALGNHRVRHALGFDLPDDAARAHAESEIRELLETTMGKRLGKDCAIEVCDAKRHLLFRVSCKDFLKRTRRKAGSWRSRDVVRGQMQSRALPIERASTVSVPA
jgi:hypothetical protein